MNAEEKNLNWHDKANSLKTDNRPVIAGQRIAVDSGDIINRENPADEKVGIDIINCDQGAVDKAVATAEKAYANSWAQIPPMQRKHVLSGLAGLLMQHQEELALLDSIEMGKPIAMALMEVQIASGFFSYYAEAVDKTYGRTAPSTADTLEIQTRRPRGVVAALTPWNFPIINLALKAAPILAAGNSVVLKPSEYSVLSALRVAELALEAGIPEGVINVITGGPEVGRALVQHEDINMVTFTGSTETGKKVMQTIGGSSALKPMLLECGGKNPQLVFADMLQGDIQALANGIVQSAMMNQGQVCVARSRLLIEQSVYEQVLEAVVNACQALQPADPLLMNTLFGPLANRMQYDKVMAAVAAAKESNIELVVDGSTMSKPDKGFYTGPYVFSHVASNNAIATEEIFGPVLSAMPFTDEQEAMNIANDTKYGLAATVWTKDLARGHRLSQVLNAGWIAVNAEAKETMGAAIAHSHEPYGQSGFGIEGGMAGLESYTRLQATTFTYE